MKHGGGGYVPLGKLRGTLDAMVEQVGFRETSRRIGCSRASLSYWLHLSKPSHHGKPARRVFQTTAARIIQARITLNEDIKAGRVVPLADGNRRRSRKRTGRCSGCGTTFDNFTDGCVQCGKRRRKHEEQEAA